MFRSCSMAVGLGALAAFSSWPACHGLSSSFLPNGHEMPESNAPALVNSVERTLLTANVVDSSLKDRENDHDLDEDREDNDDNERTDDRGDDDDRTDNEANENRGKDQEPNRHLWKAHGLLMAISWGGLVPIAIGSSLLRHLLRLTEKGLWFQIHRGVMSMASLCVMAGFAIAVVAIQKEDGGEAEHFEEDHGKIGLSVVVLLVGQVLMGVFRPHLPSAQHDKNDQSEENEQESAPQPQQVCELPKKSPQRVAFEIGHRLLAMTPIALSWYNIILGIDEYESEFVSKGSSSLLMWFWVMAGSIVGVIAILYMVQTVAFKK
jgi:Eukaryotic cytochrome b561